MKDSYATRPRLIIYFSGAGYFVTMDRVAAGITKGAPERSLLCVTGGPSLFCGDLDYARKMQDSRAGANHLSLGLPMERPTISPRSSATTFGSATITVHLSVPIQASDWLRVSVASALSDRTAPRMFHCPAPGAVSPLAQLKSE
jgi:hypothetical protein